MAIRLTTCFFIIMLVVGFANVECLLWQEQGIDLVTLTAEKFRHMFGCLLLRFITIEDTAAVYCGPKSGPTPSGLCRVVNLEEEFT